MHHLIKLGLVIMICAYVSFVIICFVVSIFINIFVLMGILETNRPSIALTVDEHHDFVDLESQN